MTKVDEDVPVSTNAVAAPPDRKAALKGILGMSAEERTQLLDELILNDQPSLPFLLFYFVYQLCLQHHI